MYGLTDIDGDVVIKEDYFPWVTEIFINGYRKRVDLLGRQEFLTYRSLEARTVLYEPLLHRDMVVRTIGVKIKGDGGEAENIYPDGTREFANSNPNIERLREMVGK